jgi:uncharacterized membrane protein YgcG
MLVVLHSAGLLQALAAACEQVAAVLSQQQQPQQQQQRQVKQLLTQLSHIATTSCLLGLWLSIVSVCKNGNENGMQQLFGVPELQHSIVPACKLWAAAAIGLVGVARPGSSSSGSSSSFWDSAASPAALRDVMCGISVAVANCTNTEYEFGGIKEGDE